MYIDVLQNKIILYYGVLLLKLFYLKKKNVFNFDLLCFDLKSWTYIDIRVYIYI